MMPTRAASIYNQDQDPMAGHPRGEGVSPGKEPGQGHGLGPVRGPGSGLVPGPVWWPEPWG